MKTVVNLTVRQSANFYL